MMTDQEQTERGASTVEAMDDSEWAAREIVRLGRKVRQLAAECVERMYNEDRLRADLERVTAELELGRAEWAGWDELAQRMAQKIRTLEAERDAMRERVSLLANAAQAFRNGRYEMGEAWLARVESLNATRKATADATEGK